VPAAAHERGPQARIRGNGVARDHRRWQKGVIVRMDQQGLGRDRMEKRRRTRTCVVVVRVAESVERRGRGVIELPKRAGGEGPPRVNAGAQLRLSCTHLGPKRPEQPVYIEPRHTVLRELGTRGQVVGHRDGDRGIDGPSLPFPPSLPLLPEVLEQHVAAHREPHRPDSRSRVLAAQQGQDVSQVLGFAGVVQPPASVQLAAARSEIEAHGSEAMPAKLTVGLQGVARPGGPFEPVQDDHHRPRRIGAGRRRRPVEIEEVAVGQVDPLARQADSATRARPPGAHGLAVRAGQPPGGRERVGGRRAAGRAWNL
jgi:hypothetical protein